MGLLKEVLDIENLKTNEVVINLKQDFPVPSGGAIQLEAKRYYINRAVSITTDHFIPPAVGTAQIIPATLDASITYTGTGAMFTGSDFGTILADTAVFSAPNGSFFDLDNAGLAFFFNCIFVSCVTIGTVKCNSFSIDFAAFSFCGGGIIFDDRTDNVKRSRIFLNELGISLGLNNTTTLMTFKGNTDGLLIKGGGAIPGSNETIFDFDSTLKDNGATIELQGYALTFPFPGSAIFTPNSLRQDYINAVFANNTGIENSTAVAKLSFVGNTAITTIATQNENTVINSNVLYVIDSLIERFLIQDVCTFDNTTNTINTTFNHGMANNDRTFLNAYSITNSVLPAELDNTTEYFIIDVTAAGFKLSLTSGGSVVNFDDDGTDTLHYRHSTGVTQLAHFIYVGNETIKCSANGWETLESTTGTKIDVRATVMDIALDGTITEGQIGAPISVNSSESGVSNISNVSTLSKGEGNTIYHRNDSDTTNIIGKDLLTSYSIIS